MAYDVATAKLHLGITGSADDTLLAMLLTEAQALAERYCDRKFNSQTYTEWLDGNNTDTLLLREYPITSVTGIWVSTGDAHYEDGVFPSSDLLTEGTDYGLVLVGSVRNGIVKRFKRVWPGRLVSTIGLVNAYLQPGYGNIKATYVAGYDPIPVDLQMAMFAIMGNLYRRSKYNLSGPVTSTSFEDRSLSFSGTGSYAGSGPLNRSDWIFDAGVREILKLYKRITLI